MKKLKLCKKCGLEKDLVEFHNQTEKSDGKQSNCRECRNKLKRIYDILHKKENHIYYLKNIKRHKKLAKKYRKEHIKEMKKYKINMILKNPLYYRNSQLKSLFGITIEQYQKLRKKQNDVCAICGKKETVFDKRINQVRSLSVDHCHKTGKVRGLLCQNCNTAIGRWKDDIKIMKKAIKYLEKKR